MGDLDDTAGTSSREPVGEVRLEFVTFVVDDGEVAAAAAVHSAAAQHGVLGAVVEQLGEEQPGVPRVVLGLPVGEAGETLLLRDGRVTAGRSALDVADEVAGALRAVPVWHGHDDADDDPDDDPDDDADDPDDDVDDVYDPHGLLVEDDPDDPDDVPAEDVPADAVVDVLAVTAFSGGRAVDDELAVEVAGLVQSDVVLVPAGTWTVVVHGAPRDGVDLTPWWSAQRPAVGLVLGGDGLLLQAHLRRAPARRGPEGVRPWEVRQRWRRWVLGSALPAWSWQVLPQRVVPLVDVAARAGLDEPVRRQVLDLQGQPEVSVLADALGLDPAQRLRLEGALGEPLTPGLPRRLVEVLGLPAVVGEVFDGRVDPRSLPGAVAASPHGIAGTFREALLSRPEGGGWLARLRRLDHDRPRLAVAFVAGEAVLGAVMAAWALGAFGPRPATPWAVLLGAGAALCALDAVGGAVLQAALRRRRRRSRT